MKHNDYRVLIYIRRQKLIWSIQSQLADLSIFRIWANITKHFKEPSYLNSMKLEINLCWHFLLIKKDM